MARWGAGSAGSASSDSDTSSEADWDRIDLDGADAAPAVLQLAIEGEDDRSRLVTIGSDAQRHALGLALAQRLSGSECLVIDIEFLPPLQLESLTDQSLVHFVRFGECAHVVPGLAHQRRVEEGAPRKRRGARAGRAPTAAPARAGTEARARAAPPQRVPVAILSECTFKVIRLGPLMLQIKTRKHFGALMTATAHVLLDQRLRFTADYSDVPRVPSRAEAAEADPERDALQATVAETLSARPGQRYQVALYCEGEPGCCEDTEPARKIARGRWQPDLPTELNFLRIAVNVYKKVAAQDRLVAARV
jgi:hypothetical protein